MMENDNVLKPKPVLLLTGGDPWGDPTGGQTTFAKHLLTVFGPRLAVCSHCDDESIPVCKWVHRTSADTQIWFFNRGPIKGRKDRKSLIPARVLAYYKARKYMPKIRQMDFCGVLIDSPEILFAASSYNWESICYRFAGVNNPVANSRYPWARILGEPFEKYHIRILSRMNPNTMIAAADQKAIEEFLTRTGNVLDRTRFHMFPTRVNTHIFYPIERNTARNFLRLPLDRKILVATGRLCWIKGWAFLLKALVHIKENHPDVLLVFVGDGEDRGGIEQSVQNMDLSKNVLITGFVSQSDVMRYMNAADVCLVGSHREGWSLAMCEMLACGKPVVSTDVSGASDMICDGMNGYVVKNRDPQSFSEAICKAFKLFEAKAYSLQKAKIYSIENLAKDLASLWSPIRNQETYN